MPSAASDAVRGFWLQNRGLIVPTLMATSVLAILVPLPPALLDLLLSANVGLAVLILLTTMYVKRPLEFSVFPSLLLGTTLARLVLNVASTRLILERGGIEGEEAAGGVIRAFGEFMAGGQLAIGVIVFIIVFVIQFLVITKGATRISEVAARFALDGMPGRQMAIDAELQAGAIDAETARRRREDVVAQADYYAAMDGAGKFVRGDAIAGLVITLINIVGGIYIGIVEHGLSLSEATSIFTRLTIGDGLVTQIPAFLITLASGLLVTRTSADSDLPGEMVGQILVRPQAMAVSAALLAGLAFTGLPMWPLLALSGVLATVTLVLHRSRHAAPGEPVGEPAIAPIAEKPPARPEDSLFVDPMELELGFALIRLADAGAGGDLLERVARIRHKIAEEFGIILPRVRIRDNIRLKSSHYQIRIHDVPVAWGEVRPDGLMAIESAAVSGRIPGIAAVEPATGRPCVWIEPAGREQADRLGYNVVEPAAAIAMHLTETVRRHSDELLSRQQVHQLLDKLKLQSPQLVDELVPGVVKPSLLHQVLCNLLRERVPVRNLEIILQTLGDHADRTKDAGALTESVRQALARTICQQYRDRERVLRVVTLDPALEAALGADLGRGEHPLSIGLPPHSAQAVVRGIVQSVGALAKAGYPPVLLTTRELRAAVRQATAPSLPALAVLSLDEITRDTRVELAGQVTAGEEHEITVNSPTAVGV